MYFKESTNPSKILTNDYTEKFYLRDQRVKPLRKREQLPTNESRISSQSSIYGNNVTLEDSIEKNLEPLKQYKQDAVVEKGHYPQNHVHIQAEGKLKCACTICTAQNLMRTEPDDPFTDPFFVNLQNGLNDHQISLERGFVFVLKRLMPLRHMTHGLSIKVPETLVYIDGEAKFFALTGKDKTLKFLNQREKLAQHEIRKFFYERFALKDEEQRISESRNAFESKNLLPSTNEISTERTQGIDLRKGTPSSQLGIGKITRHKATKSLKIKPLPASREVALLKFNDDSTTILCEPEFENLIIKKKFDPYWRNIAFIQNYRGFSKYIHTLQRVYFIYDREKNNPLFTRAAVEVYQLIKEIAPSSDSYIPAFEEENFQKNLRKHSESDYCLYLIMKVFHFIEIVHGYKINKMCGEFVKDINDVLWLTNVTHLQYQKKIARGVDENNGKVRSMFNLDTEERSSIQDSLHEIKRKDDVNVLSELMQKQYNNIKGSVGIKEPVPTYQEDISDNIFSQLYPNAPYRLSMLLKANSKPNHVNNPKNIASDNSFRVSSTRRTLEDERQLPSGPIKGVYMGMTRNTPSQNNVTSHNTSAIGNQSNRNSVIKKRVVKPRGESNENMSKQSRTPMPSMPSLPSLGNIDGYTNVSMAVEPKKQAQKSGDGRSTRSNSQPNMKKTFKFYGLNPNIANHYPKIPNDTFKDAAHQRILQRTPSDLIAHVPKMTKLTTMEGDVYTERCTPVGDRSRNSNPNTPYRKGLRGLSREAQGKLAVQLDQGSTTKRSQSVNKRALGYILNN